MSKEIKDAAQDQAERAFDDFMTWMKRITYVSIALLLAVVVGCNSGVQDSTYPAYNGEQYDPQGMSK
tara:strand:- start:485 stop:685 length:201 start_codon:yes stop_codon:yes gene_type:complete